MNKKVIMLGNEAIARGAYEAGVKVSAAYPGTPSTEISEALVQYKGDVYAEWSPNEKVAVEVAIGASIAGARSMACMKHVGLNVASDPLYTLSYTGVTGGVVIVVADDPGLYSSQNEQDTRMIARAAHVPVLEPSDSREALEFTKLAYDLSEQYDRPFILRTTTRLSHSQSIVELSERVEKPLIPYEKKIDKYVMMPAMAAKRHKIILEKMDELSKAASSMSINRVEMNDTKIGIITSGISYQYVKEALPEASVLKLGMVNPLPMDLIKDFASKVEKLYIIEELDPVIEDQVKANGIACEGKALLTPLGEYSATMLKKAFDKECLKSAVAQETIPNRPPILCPGCPHRSVFYVLKKLGIHAAGDIGCYTLGAVAPLQVIESTICMGASISTMHGMDKAAGKDYRKDWVAVIGDSTFLHTGVNSLINTVYNNGSSTVIILDNSTTGMTGHQDHAATGLTLQKDKAPAINLVELCHAIGVKNVNVVNSFDLEGLEKAVKEANASDDVNVIIAQSPCIMLDKSKKPTYVSDTAKCKKCGMCLKPACPAIKKNPDKTVEIDVTMCTGCGLCKDLCKFDAINLRKDGE